MLSYRYNEIPRVSEHVQKPPTYHYPEYKKTLSLGAPLKNVEVVKSRRKVQVGQ